MGLAALKVFKSRWDKSISAMPPLRAENISGGQFCSCKWQSSDPSQFVVLILFFFSFKFFFLAKEKSQTPTNLSKG